MCRCIDARGHTDGKPHEGEVLERREASWVLLEGRASEQGAGVSGGSRVLAQGRWRGGGGDCGWAVSECGQQGGGGRTSPKMGGGRGQDAARRVKGAGVCLGRVKGGVCVASFQCILLRLQGRGWAGGCAAGGQKGEGRGRRRRRRHAACAVCNDTGEAGELPGAWGATVWTCAPCCDAPTGRAVRLLQQRQLAMQQQRL